MLDRRQDAQATAVLRAGADRAHRQADDRAPPRRLPALRSLQRHLPRRGRAPRPITRPTGAPKTTSARPPRSATPHALADTAGTPIRGLLQPVSGSPRAARVPTTHTNTRLHHHTTPRRLRPGLTHRTRSERASHKQSPLFGTHNYPRHRTRTLAIELQSV